MNKRCDGCGVSGEPLFQKAVGGAVGVWCEDCLNRRNAGIAIDGYVPPTFVYEDKTCELCGSVMHHVHLNRRICRNCSVQRERDAYHKLTAKGASV